VNPGRYVFPRHGNLPDQSAQICFHPGHPHMPSQIHYIFRIVIDSLSHGSSFQNVCLFLTINHIFDKHIFTRHILKIIKNNKSILTTYKTSPLMFKLVKSIKIVANQAPVAIRQVGHGNICHKSMDMLWSFRSKNSQQKYIQSTSCVLRVAVPEAASPCGRNKNT
jgi:hypothetical protein